MTKYIIGFTGCFLDTVSFGYALGDGYRWYMPGLMRFNAPDSLSPFGPAGVNPYVYCAGDPINLVDISGHFPVATIDEVWDAIAAVDARETERATETTITSAAGADESSDSGLVSKNTRKRVGTPVSPHEITSTKKREGGNIDPSELYRNALRRGEIIWHKNADVAQPYAT